MSKHILTVTVDPSCEYCANDDPAEWCGSSARCIRWSVTCPGVTDECRCWWECMDCNRDPEARDALANGDGMAHGVEHRLMAAGWSTWSDQCAISWVEEVGTAVQELEPAPGSYEIEVDWDDPPGVALTRVTVAAAS
jgi:hypothetical protein